MLFCHRSPDDLEVLIQTIELLVPDGGSVVLNRLPPGAQGAETDDEVRALLSFMEATEKAQAMDRDHVRDWAAGQIDSEHIVESVITAGNIAC